MATPNRTELRAIIPALEPDDVLLDQLAALARSSALEGPPARTAPRTGWRVTLAAVAGDIHTLSTSMAADLKRLR